MIAIIISKQEHLRVLREIDVDAAIKRSVQEGRPVFDRKVAEAAIHKARTNKNMRKHFTHEQLEYSRNWLKMHGFKQG